VVAVAAVLAVLGQLWGLYLPRAPEGTDWFPGADKLGHALAFALPVVLIPWAETPRRRAKGRQPRARVLVLVVWVSAAHAVVSELVQHAAYRDRVGDPLDVLADLSGIAVGGLLAGVALTMRQLGGRRPYALLDRLPVDG
jgi:hypothetical protein